MRVSLQALQMSDAGASADGGVMAAPLGHQLEYDPAVPWTALDSSSRPQR